MSLQLVRIDQRLVHGIVVTQYTSATKAKRIMVVDDVICDDETQKNLMRMSKPAGTGMSIISTETAIKNFGIGKYDNHNVLIVVKEPETVLKLIEGGVKIPEVDIGIVFNTPNSEPIVNQVYLNDKQKKDLKKIEELGVPVYFQYVPTNPKEELSKYI
ncbi:PTS sugar transporter subunit IIB [Anaerococcus sp. AGMB00486]|uniref:PTS sugar transporter subunit IIB n=2 Tax=Anaerococcus TaxID=165779 RepID=A0ABX2NC12_9FIRM|nr:MULTISPECIES: PTS sugar transporter subunit IIB [Anaerococcus]MSS77826.1 PTS sugar transporter subunit IIB [Anaerococcus porci]NVF12260.1 PTS sugar transporter subunit IIB [Anaerococcus faecalis]